MTAWRSYHDEAERLRKTRRSRRTVPVILAVILTLAAILAAC